MKRRQFLSHVLLGATACWTTGCGTLLYNERVGRPHSGRLDWKIVALDGLGLILFFVPGVIAFVVDFATGAIFLPAGYADSGLGPGLSVMPQTEVASNSMPPHVTTPTQISQPAGLRRVAIPRNQLDLHRIEQVASQHVGRPVSLDDNQARVSTLAHLDRFDDQLNRHQSNVSFGQSVRLFFESRVRG